MYSLLIAVATVANVLSNALDPADNRSVARPAMKRLPLVALGLVAVLLAAGQLARAAAGPGPNDVQDSLPFWDPNGVRIAFERTASVRQHVLSTTSAGKDTVLVYATGVVRGYLGDRFLVQSGSQTLITERRSLRRAAPRDRRHRRVGLARGEASRIPPRQRPLRRERGRVERATS